MDLQAREAQFSDIDSIRAVGHKPGPRERRNSTQQRRRFYGGGMPQAEWAYQRPYYSNRERLNPLPGFLAYYNHQRPNGGIGGATPASRL